jgi:hypothetical protein
MASPVGRVSILWKLQSHHSRKLAGRGGVGRERVMTSLRTNILLATLGIFAAAAQLIATRWGLTGDIVGGFLCGLIVMAGLRMFALEPERSLLPTLVAAAASLSGLGLRLAGADTPHPPAVWASPLFATFPFGVLALKRGLHGARCPLCQGKLRGLLSFTCPRCHLIACENCWYFERGRCRLCDTNQVPLFPLDHTWWQQHFGAQVRDGRCALCLQAADWKVSHWTCASCGNSQCRVCWDDNNGQCSRCGWIIPGLPPEISDYVAAGVRQEKITH